MYDTLTLAYAFLHAKNFGLQSFVTVLLLLDLSLESCEVGDNLIAQRMTVHHFLLELLVLKNATRCFLV